MPLDDPITSPTIQPTAPPLVGSLEVDDPVLYEEIARPWDFCVTPLTAGPFVHRKKFLLTPAFALYQDSFECPSRVFGMTPPGLLGFAVPIRLGRRSTFWNDSLHEQGLPASPPGALEANIDVGQIHLICLISLDFIHRTLVPEVTSALLSAAATRVLPASGAKIEGLKRMLLCTLRQARRRPMMLEHPAVMRALEADLLARLLETVELPGLSADRRPSPIRRQRGLDRALEFLRDADLSVLTVPGLCGESGVSQRTLEYAFLDTYGMTPLAFLRRRRFHAVRRQLTLAPVGGLTITQAAYSQGFYQLGRFTAEYRQLFGERPLETLQRSPRLRSG
jgi:AraC family transcriptional regulator, ethanolamine operon transcriptional activator